MISFGDASKASIATLGLNPSKREFLSERGHLLVGSGRRLATHQSLGCSNLRDAPASVIQQVLDDSNRYFCRNPYEWFSKFTPILEACGVSYYEGSACSLDLVQWATTPVWGKLTEETKEGLLSAGTHFLDSQLRENQNIKLVLANGAGVIKHLEDWLGLRFHQTDLVARFSVRNAPLFTGEFTEGLRQIPIIGWRVNLQSDKGVYGVTKNGIAELAERVGELYSSGC